MTKKLVFRVQGCNDDKSATCVHVWMAASGKSLVLCEEYIFVQARASNCIRYLHMCGFCCNTNIRYPNQEPDYVIEAITVISTSNLFHCSTQNPETPNPETLNPKP